MADDKQSRILDAAMRLINRYGFDKTTIAEIAKEAGVAKGTVYLYFESKDDLYYSLLAREANRFREKLNPKLKLAANPVEELQVFLLELGLVKLFSELAEQTARKDLQFAEGWVDYSNSVNLNQEWFEFLSDMIKRGIDQGYFRAVDPNKVSLAIFSAIGGLAALNTFANGMFSKEQIMDLLDTTIDLVIHGLVKGELR